MDWEILLNCEPSDTLSHSHIVYERRIKTTWLNIEQRRRAENEALVFNWTIQYRFGHEYLKWITEAAPSIVWIKPFIESFSLHVNDNLNGSIDCSEMAVQAVVQFWYSLDFIFLEKTWRNMYVRVWEVLCWFGRGFPLCTLMTMSHEYRTYWIWKSIELERRTRSRISLNYSYVFRLEKNI